MDFSNCVVAYQGGDSYPGDNRVEDEVRRRLPGRFIDHLSILTAYQSGQYTSRIPLRLATLRRLWDDLPNEDFILVGRSSGARVATLHASTRPPRLRGVVCLGYPFRNPEWPPEPARVAHLADLAVPTLILQGDSDDYGGAEAAARYALSPSVAFQVVRAGHEFHIPQDVWDEIGQRIRDFITAL